MNCPYERLVLDLAASLDGVTDGVEREQRFNNWLSEVKQSYGPECWSKGVVLARMCLVSPSSASNAPSRLGLAGGKMKQIHQAMLVCFPGSLDLEIFLRFKLDKQLNHIAAEGTLSQKVFSVIDNSDRHGWLGLLLQNLIDEYSTTPEAVALGLILQSIQ